MKSDEPGFWDERYGAGRMAWDAGGVPRAVRGFLARCGPAGGARALLPGCGSGYEVRAFHAAGWDVTAIDFAPAAVARARCVLGELASCVHRADFFRDDFGRDFDLVYERTFLCSLPPETWPSCATRLVELLRPGGKLAGLFFYGHEPEPPPFPLSQATAVELFGRDFALEEDEPVPAEDSLPLYAGAERWQVWEKLRG